MWMLAADSSRKEQVWN